MATGGSSMQLCFCFCFCFLSILNALSSSEATLLQDFKRELQREEEEQILPSSRRTLKNLLFKTTEFNSINPVTTPSLNAPPANQVPTVVTIPATVPNTNPVNPPIPATNPVTTPGTIPGGTPIPAGGVAGQSWCIAKNGASQTALQAALDYACGIGKADCTSIQQGTSCYNPNSLQNHASFAFNSYYQKNPVKISCDFGGIAVITSTNPSSGSCIYPSSSASSSSSPAVGNQTTITTPTPTTTPTTGNSTTIPTPTTTPTNTPTTTPTPTITPTNTPTTTTTPTTIPTTTPTPTPTTSSSSSPAIGTPTTISTPTTSSSSGSSPGGAIPGDITPPSVLNSSSGFPDSGTTTGFGATPPMMNSISSSAPAALQPFVACLTFLTSTMMGIFIIRM